jgi:hypothetical protein
MVKLATQRSQARFYVTKAIPISQLSKGHRQILIPTRKASRPCISEVASHTTPKLAVRQEAQQLREDGSALIHSSLWTAPGIRLSKAQATFQIAASQMPVQLSARKALASGEPFISRTVMRQTIGAQAVYLLIASLASVSAQAGTVGIAYSFAGASSAPPVPSDTNLIVDNSATGAFISGNPGLDVKWNPVSFTNHCIIDLTTGLLNGKITFVFADGATLFGNEFEDVSAVVATGGTGPFTETYTFTGGTGEFAGASGSVSGAGLGVATEFTEPGSGSLTAPTVSAPEPTSAALMFGGLLGVAWLLPTLIVQSRECGVRKYPLHFARLVLPLISVRGVPR